VTFPPSAAIHVNINIYSNYYTILFYFLGVLLLTIFGSDLPPKPIKSSGQELVIKFKSHFRNGPFYSKNNDAKFLLTYDTEYNSKLTNHIHSVIIKPQSLTIKCILIPLMKAITLLGI